MTKVKTARFWEYHSGLVRIKIKAGQTLHHCEAGPTDEGYSRYTRVFSFDGATVTCEWHSDATDCDGRHTRGGISHCPVTKLAAGYDDVENDARFPAWQEGCTFQRDHTAEAANY